MTLRNSAYAINGALLDAFQVREALFTSTNGAEGLSGAGDMQVLPLVTPGQGIRITPGGALVLNRYQGVDPDQTYSVSNPTTTTILPTSMPGSVASIQHYLVLVTVGDPDFSQVSHPWMTSTPIPDNQKATFEYVRFHIMPCPNGTTDFADLGLSFPAYALARLEVPANTTTITSAMIKPLAEVARPRSQTFIGSVDLPATQVLDTAAGTWENFPNANILTVKIPKWATTCKLFGYVEGIRIAKPNGQNRLRIKMFQGSTTIGTTGYTNVVELGATDSSRRTYNVGGQFAVPVQYRGTSVSFVMEGSPSATADVSSIRADTATSMFVSATFEESNS